MRILVCFDGGPGHFAPMLPVAAAAVRRGHDVAVACRPSAVNTVVHAGFRGMGVGTSTPRPGGRQALAPVDIRREEAQMRGHVNGPRTRVRLAAVRDLAQELAPDVMLVEETDFAATVAAQLLGLPFATVLILMSGSLTRAEIVAEPLDELRRSSGLLSHPGGPTVSPYLVLSPFSPDLRDPGCPLPDVAHRFRPLEPSARPVEAPVWMGSEPDGPSVYVTLGTEFNLESGDLFERTIAGVRDLSANVLVTVGEQLDPTEFGPQPAHVHVERYVPQEEVLPVADVVVCHGGSGTVTGALAYGLPVLTLAMGADQPANARRLRTLGVGRELDPVGATPRDVRDAVASMLVDADARRRARTVAAGLAGQSSPLEAVGLLERLAVECRPMPAAPDG